MGLTNLGTYDLSGAALKTNVDAAGLTTGYLSGQFYFIPNGIGQVHVLKLED